MEGKMMLAARVGCLDASLPDCLAGVLDVLCRAYYSVQDTASLRAGGSWSVAAALASSVKMYCSSWGWVSMTMASTSIRALLGSIVSSSGGRKVRMLQD